MDANLLWAHLLRKDATTTTTTDTPSQIPALAPQDRTGTSMRMLLHDTQVNLEQFSARLDGLLQRVDDCRAEVVHANKLLDVERDKVLTEIREIAHRCQTDMKAHVGAPAQAPALELAHVAQVSTERSVHALEKRVDALQTLLQAHAAAMQSIQDQQNTLIGAVLPLVPLVQGVAPLMDQLKAALSDVVANAVATVTGSVDNVRSTLVAELAHGWARPSTGSSSKLTTSSRRTRQNISLLAPRDTHGMPSSPLESRSHEGPRTSLKRARVEGAVEHEQVPRKMSRLVVPVDRTPSLRTPRQPLADLPLDAAKVRHPMLRDYMHAGIPGSASRPHARPPMQDRRSATPRGVPFVVDNMAPPPLNQGTLSKTLETKPVDVISVHSSPLSSPPSTNAVQRGAEDASGSPPTSMSLRDRRAQMLRCGRTETRRFIPVVPWSDEEE